MPARRVALTRLAAAPRIACAAALALGAATLVAASSTGVTFTDVTASAGITFTHVSGAFGKKYLPETMGSGVAFLDYDADGFVDIFFVNSTTWPGRPAARALPALYRNARNGTFVDATKQAGLAFETYGLGAAAADYDNDGDVDLFVTALGGNRLFRNTGRGTFTDVTKQAGVGASAFSTSAAWVDYENDGWLDLVVLNYVQWTIASDRVCSLDGTNKSYCTPESYTGASPILYRNRGDGTFRDVTRDAGLSDPTSKALGIALLDIEQDGWLDLFVANDTQPNRLYRNSGAKAVGRAEEGGSGVRFTDEAVSAGVAFNDAGAARAGMGTDAADYDGSGRDSLVIGNFSNEMMALYRNEGNHLFLDQAPTGTIGRASALSLTFSCFFFDYDLDGRLDIFAANGHVADDIEKAQPKVTYAQAPLLFRNAGDKGFDVADAGPALKTRMVARGAAYADYDLDGDLDVVVTTNNGPARLFRNERVSGGGAGAVRARVVRVTLAGTTSNRSAIGARVAVTYDNGTVRRAMVKTGSSYLSQSELPLTFGLGDASNVRAIEIRWPSGRIEKLPGVEAGQHLTIEEGRGIVRRAALGQAGATTRPAAR